MADPLTDALLAPVPINHLRSAVEAFMHRVAFGSDAYDTFHGVPKQIEAPGFRALLYPSYLYDWGEEAEPFVRFEGRFGGWEAAERLEEEDLKSVRPGSVYASGNEEPHWALFWFVEDLRELPERIPLGRIQRLSGGRLDPGFVPRGPIFVRDPR
jgi:hypothetical protein